MHRSGDNRSILSLTLKHDTPAPLLNDHVVGSIEIEVDQLLQVCHGVESVTLELRKKVKKPVIGLLSVRLDVVDVGEATKVVLSNVQKDITEAPPSVPDHLCNVVSKLSLFVDIVDEASKVHPYAKFAWQIISSLYNAVKAQVNRDKDLMGLVATMEDVCSFVDVIKSIPNRLQHLEDIISDILKQMVECSIFIREYTGHGFAARAVEQTFSNADQVIESMSSNLTALRRSFDTGVALQNVFISSRTCETLKSLVSIESLKRLNSVDMDASLRQECLPDTRQDVLRSIVDWLTIPTSEHNILWLHGLAGSGKSTISTTIAEYFRGIGRLGAFLFFDRNNPACSHPRVFVATLCEQLASFDPTIREAICTQIDRDQSITKATIRVQFSKLLVEPLRSIAALYTAGPIIVIVDAFDECGNASSRPDLLNLIAQEFAKLPSVFRFLITSRREPDIEAALSTKSNVVTRELDIGNNASTTDISTYLRHHFSKFRENPVFELNSDWPDEDTIPALTKASAGLFIWASTAVQFIAEGQHPDQQLRLLLRPHPKEAEAALDQLYAIALGSACNWSNSEMTDIFRAVVGSIAIGREPLTHTSLDRLLGLSGYQASRFILARFRCLIRWDLAQPARILHASFADYLTDIRRSGNQPWFVDSSTHHLRLVNGCFQIMKQELRFNICNLDTSHLPNSNVPDIDARIEQYISPHLSYACRFWSDHLQETSFSADCALGVNEFFNQRFLFWLEVLSLTGKVRLATPALVATGNWAEQHDTQIVQLLDDANYFVSTFRHPISTSAPHIYVSAIPFSPNSSWVKTQYGTRLARGLSVSEGKMFDWPRDHFFLEGHTDVIFAFALSPDGQRIASCSFDCTVRIWDLHTGDPITTPFRGHTRDVFEIAFSPDSQQVVSGSFDTKVFVLDANTGDVAFGPFEKHTGMIRLVGFACNGLHVVSTCHDDKTFVWNAKTGTIIAGPFDLKAPRPGPLTISPDGRMIASHHEHCVLLWDVATGTLTTALDIPDVLIEPNMSHYFSANSRMLVTLWQDGVTRVLNLEKDEVAEVSTGRQKSASLSNDGRRIVTGSNDARLCVWDVATSSLVVGPYEVHHGFITQVAFSPNGGQVVSRGRDGICISKPSCWAPQQILDRYCAPAFYVLFSHDARHVVSASSDGSFQVWDAETGRGVARHFYGHNEAFLPAIAIPPGDLQVWMCCDGRDINIWDARTGQVTTRQLDLTSADIQNPQTAFSPDCQQLLLVTTDQKALWCTQTGKLSLALAVTEPVSCVAFSPSGLQIACGTLDGVIELWDAKTGELTKNFTVLTYYARRIALIHEGRLIIAVDGSQLRIFEVSKERCVWMSPYLAEGLINDFSFLSNTQLIAVSYTSGTVYVWDTKTTEDELRPIAILNGHAMPTFSVAFSPDGRRIASGSFDETVRVWDVDRAIASQRDGDHEDDLHAPPAADGWVRGRNSELLYWSPPQNRVGVWNPLTVLIIGRKKTRLDFSRFVHGTSWRQCYTLTDDISETAVVDNQQVATSATQPDPQP